MIETIFDSSVEMLSVRLSWLTPAPDATKVRVVPLTVIVSLSRKLVPIESVPRGT